MTNEKKSIDPNGETFKISYIPVKLNTSQLRWKCSKSLFDFETTSELEPLNEIIGQPRAVESIRLGAELKSKGYNIFVSGLAGTGRLTTVKRLLENIEISDNILYDYCYVNNFKTPDSPVLIRFDRGKAREFASLMDESIQFLKLRLPKMFEDESLQSTRKKIIEDFQDKESEIVKDFDEKIKPFGFIRGQIEAQPGIYQPEVYPLIDGEAIAIDGIAELVANNKITREKADELIKLYNKFHNELIEVGRKHLKMMQEFKKVIADNDKLSASLIVNAVFNDIKIKYNEPKILDYLDEVQKNILDNFAVFVPASENVNPQSESEFDGKDGNKFNIYSVNVILDNSENTKAPIIVETTPSYTNLFGTIERTYDNRGFWRTDFTKIKAGSLLKADNGFLIVNALDLFEEPGVWQSLKRLLLYNKLEIQTFEAAFQFAQVFIKPEPIEISVKVIIIGGLTLFKSLYEYEKGFKSIFKINAQFDYEANRTDEIIHQYSKFISKICTQDNLPHCTPSGVASIVEWAVEQTGSKDKITLRFTDVADIIREAAYFDRTSDKDYIDERDVKKAIEKRKYRNDMFDEKLTKNILEGTILIDTDGERVGQINGLTVLDDGIISFGKPARITANVSAGNAGIVNIEREVEMSGPIHNKGVLIISGFIKEKFSQKKPLNLSATIAFEQNYGGIDGDSASAAEIYVLLSAISGIPIRQNFAITGSMNQKGDIQPIGGVNFKIRGYYAICKSRGLTGTQGVIIPSLNVADLMLPDEIINDVEKGMFHIFSIKRIEEGFNLLFNVEAGKADSKGNYPAGTVFYKVAKRLEKFSEKDKSSNDSKKSKSKKKK